MAAIIDGERDRLTEEMDRVLGRDRHPKVLGWTRYGGDITGDIVQVELSVSPDYSPSDHTAVKRDLRKSVRLAKGVQWGRICYSREGV